MLALVLLASMLATPGAAPAVVPSAEPSPTPQRVLGLIRSRFHSHGPPPPYETYTLVRSQKATNGYPDPVDSYIVHVWARTVDGAALTRLVYRDEARGPLKFDRPAFNGDVDPGPPTADIFQPGPVRVRPVSVPRTPDPYGTPLPVIGGVRALFETDYRVDSLTTEGDLVHLRIYPIRDVERNRLREVYADAKTLELRRLIAADKLFSRNQDGKYEIYPLVYTITMGTVQGYPVVKSLHGVVGGGYAGDGQEVDFRFDDIAFPATLPAWYFDPRAYAAHQNDAPS
jgi:hypothetical protein